MTAPVPLRKLGTRPQLFPSTSTDAVEQGARFQGAADTATKAAADSAGYDYSRDVGARLGGLAGIGALRSGGASAGIAEAGRTFSERVGNAAASHAMEAAQLGQNEASDLRRIDLTKSEGAANRGSTEKIAANDLGFQGQKLAEQKSEFGQDLGFRNKNLDVTSATATADRSSREGIATAGNMSAEKVASLDVQSREKLAALELDFKNRGLSSEEARAQAQLQFQKESSAADLGFKNKALEQDSRFHTEDLGFKTNQAGIDNANEQARQAEAKREFDQQRADAQKAAQQKQKSGLFGFIGKALGTVAGFIPGLGVAGKIAGAVLGGSSSSGGKAGP